MCAMALAQQKMNTMAVNDLLKKLESSIASGNDQEAAGFATELATLKVQCSVKRNRTKYDDLLNVDMYIEDRLAHQGPISLELPLLMTVAQLKEKISHVYNIPANVQRWTINNTVADNNDATLDDLHALEGSAVFLYLVAPNLQIGNLIKRPRIEWEECNFTQFDSNDDDDNEDEDYDGDDDGDGDNDDDDDDDDDKSNASLDDKKLNNENDSNEENKVLPIIAIESPVENPVNPLLIDKMAHNDDVKLIKVVQVEEPVKIQHKVIVDINEEEITTNGDIKIINSCVNKDSVEPIKHHTQPEEYEILVMLESCDVVPNNDYLECPICFVFYEPYESVRLRNCLHAFCRDCLVNTIKHCDDPEVKCPYVDEDYACQSMIQEREIKALADADIYEAHLAKSISHAECSAGKTAFHCKTPNCAQWCFYDNDRNYFLCPTCDKTNCLKCEVIHEGRNCCEYKEDIRISKNPTYATNLTQEKVLDLIRNDEAMKCPTCSILIMKESGCDALTCIMCKTEICWVTKKPRWGPAGHGDTSGGCKCKVNGAKCHPQCRNCH